MCNQSPSVIQRFKYLITGDISTLSVKGYWLSWSREKMSKSLKKKVFKRDSNTCHYCKIIYPVKELTVDHYIPYSVIKQHSLNNLVAACQMCNAAKADINPVDPKDAVRWQKFLKRKFKINGKIIQGIISKQEQAFKEKKIDFSRFLNSVLSLVEKHNFSKRGLCFQRKTNLFIKKNYPDLWEQNIDGFFPKEALNNFLNQEQKAA